MPFFIKNLDPRFGKILTHNGHIIRAVQGPKKVVKFRIFFL
jgi:hypothetical protein